MFKVILFFSAFFILPTITFASSLSVDPSTIYVGDENTVDLTYITSGASAYFYLYNSAGTNISGNSNASHPTSPIDWATTGYPTGLSAGEYTVSFYDNAGNTFSKADIDGACGVGKTKANCDATTQNITASLTISSAPVTPTSSAAEQFGTYALYMLDLVIVVVAGGATFIIAK